MIKEEKQLKEELVRQILSKLRIDASPPLNLNGLHEIYDAWCRHIPFDNVRKLIHLSEQNPSPLPGYDPIDFFEGWLQNGTGGTCWAGSDALFTLLHTLGFEVQRGVATMLVAPDVAPNHGTVIAYCNGIRYLVDTSMLHGSPFPLDDGDRASAIKPSAWSIESFTEDEKQHFQWYPLHLLSGCICRIEYLGASRETFIEYNEKTRIWGPFNYSLYGRLNDASTVKGIAFGHRVLIDASGKAVSTPMDEMARHHFLAREMGISQKILNKLSADQEMPPHPDKIKFYE